MIPNTMRETGDDAPYMEPITGNEGPIYGTHTGPVFVTPRTNVPTWMEDKEEDERAAKSLIFFTTYDTTTRKTGKHGIRITARKNEWITRDVGHWCDKKECPEVAKCNKRIRQHGARNRVGDEPKEELQTSRPEMQN